MLTGLIGPRLVAFMMGPAGRVVLLALAFVVWTMYQRVDATRDCEAAELQEELVETQRQLAIANEIAQGARDRADQTEAEMALAEGRYNELKQDLAGRPDAACPIDPDTRERLLGIK